MEREGALYARLNELVMQEQTPSRRPYRVLPLGRPPANAIVVACCGLAEAVDENMRGACVAARQIVGAPSCLVDVRRKGRPRHLIAGIVNDEVECLLPLRIY